MNTATLLHLQAAQARGGRFWQAHIEALAKSDVSRREYCRRNHLSYHALTYWLRKQLSSGAQLPLALVEVPVRGIRPGTPLRLRIGCDYLIELDAHFDEAVLVRVLAVLAQHR